jgi:hypothetical protein
MNWHVLVPRVSCKDAMCNDSPVCNEGEDEGDEGEAATQHDDETQHTLVIKGGRQTCGYTIGDATWGLWEAVDRTRVQCLHPSIFRDIYLQS